MFSEYQEKEEYEDELYREEGSSGSEVDSELEFRLYSQLHYGSSVGAGEEQQEQQEQQEQKEQKEQHVETAAEQQQAVIVIDSGPEVITLSDSTEDDNDGICFSKCKKSQQMPLTNSRRRFQGSPSPASTRGRALSRTAYKEYVISLESDSDSHCDSDSDGVEDWMVLGRDRLDGDCNIQLNLDGIASNSAAEDDDENQNWTISKKDTEARVSNKRPGSRRASQRYYTNVPKNITCHSCNRIGHLSKNCPRPKKLPCCLLCGTQGHLQWACPHRHCNNCGLPGHCYKDCLERAYWTKQCHRCGMTGHFHDDCPDLWRQYHHTTKAGPPVKPDNGDTPQNHAYCYNCSQKGHFGFECSERRMFNRTFPCIPYISYYDTVKDIRRRDNRMLKKVQELQEAGFFAGAPPQAPEAKEDAVEGGNPAPKRKNAGVTKKDEPGAPAVNSRGKALRQALKRWTEKAGVTEKDEPGAPAMNSRGMVLQQALKRWTKEKRKERHKKRLQKKQQRRKCARKGAGRPVTVNEDEDFPRGPATKNRESHALPQKHNRSATLFGSLPRGQKVKKQRARGRDRKPGGASPVDDNLFLIKQKRKR